MNQYNIHLKSFHKNDIEGLSKRLSEKHLNSFNKKKEILIISSYPPRICGIATFSMDLRDAILKRFSNNINVPVVAIEDELISRSYPIEVEYQLNISDQGSFEKLSKYINERTQLKAVILQHEFGLFKKTTPACLQHFLQSINKPIIAVFHTVLPKPSVETRDQVLGIAKQVNKVIVMTSDAKRILELDYNLPKPLIKVIPHGIHLWDNPDTEKIKIENGLEEQTILSTFGLISRNKGIDTSLKAFAIVKKSYPDIKFLIIGQTHPNVIAAEGESYRNELLALTKKLKIESDVIWINKYLSLGELLNFLSLTDIYLFSSKDPQQAVSGTLAYAMSAGCAMISTPIPQAKALQKKKAALVYEIGDVKQLSTLIELCLKNRTLINKLGERARNLIIANAWPNIAEKYMSVLDNLVGKNNRLKVYNWPEINERHLLKTTKSEGLIQFCNLSEPDLTSGYTLDDNARALIAVTMLYRLKYKKSLKTLITKYLRFIEGCQKIDGSFYNYKNYMGEFTPQNTQVNLQDSNGRAIWALGYLYAHTDSAQIREKCLTIVKKALPVLKCFDQPRAIAFSIKGLYYLGDSPLSLHALMQELSDKQITLYKKNAHPGWLWFENEMTYANSVIPEALILAFDQLHKIEYYDIALESFNFLITKIFRKNRLKIISNRTWLKEGMLNNGYGEQPIEACYTILALNSFYKITNDDSYLEKLKIAYSWFLGNNHLKELMYNPIDGGGFDGLEKNRINRNEGAESSVCFLMAQLVMEEYKISRNTQELQKKQPLLY